MYNVRTIVALLIIILFVLSGTLTLPEALAGFSDPNVILIAALSRSLVVLLLG